ncbi:uncharacterized protein zgc:112496 isoform X2 [Melanotaenia boesemani]|uniref:uncharacterized protein zgc:112496 isoform X2 n=1 Tax=Melanotaenia boesemani TaxID=1250792 RepID=UPI001C04D1AD|nr:uncharacterized protein zgc:112496 isoform X2 [Melanotaenia boesemani]
MTALFACDEPATWRSVYEKYQEELATLISSRSDKHITLSELVKLMEWKLTRGKFRPRLQQLVASNSEDTVEKCSRKAFSLLPDVWAAITELSSLKGVGPATASAVLAAGAPELAAFMSDEAMESVPGLKPIQYTTKHYALYLDKMTARSEKLNKVDPQQDWTPQKLEMCLWAMTIDTRQHLQLLNDADVKGTNKQETSDPDTDQRPAKKLKTV